MEWYESEISELEAARIRRPPVRRPAVFYGSSSIRLWDTLARDLGDERALNLGFGGSTLEVCARLFQRLVPPVQPMSMVVYAGDNDLGDGRTPEDVRQSFRLLTGQVQDRLGAIPFGFISIKPSPARFGIIDSIRKANEYIQQEIAGTTFAYWIDVFSAMLGPRGGPRPELFTDDGLHMNRAGYRLWTKALERHRSRIFTEP
jgi:lysophospholipase L1-like esterase